MDDSRLLKYAGLAAGEDYGPENNPLERDDLALRLAVKLRITLEVIEVAGAEFCEAGFDDGVVREPIYGDDLAATRRAIVRAAAAIGGIRARGE